MDSGRIHWKWSRSIQNCSRRRRKIGIMNYAKRKNKKNVLKVEPEESLTASELNSELNSDDKAAHTNNANSIEINSSVEQTIHVNEEIANNAIVKEEIEIKDEVYDHSMFDTYASNITTDFPSESNPDFNDGHSNATSEFRIGIDESLIGRHVKGIFSSETIGSKTLIVFRRLPGEPEIILPPVVNEKKSVSPKKQKTDKLKKFTFLLEREKAILKGKYTRFCSKCKIPLEVDSIDNCTLCAAAYFYGCKHCNDTFFNYFTLSYHILLRCTPIGYYHCPQCFYKSRCFKIVRRHVLLIHKHLGPDFDLCSIGWQDVARDENGAALLVHICQNCGKEFKKLVNYNIHTRTCHKIRPGLKYISTNGDSSSREDENSQVDDGRKKIMLYCEKCNKDTKVYCFFNRQSNCIDCQSKMKLRCSLCNKLIDEDSCAVKHLQVTCVREKIQCRFCGKTFLYKRNLFRHKKIHSQTANRQIESPSKNISLVKADKFPDSSKNEINSNKITVPTCKEEKMSAKSSSNPDATRHSKYYEKKLQMQCKVLLTRLRVNKSRHV